MPTRGAGRSDTAISAGTNAAPAAADGRPSAADNTTRSPHDPHDEAGTRKGQGRRAGGANRSAAHESGGARGRGGLAPGSAQHHRARAEGALGERRWPAWGCDLLDGCDEAREGGGLMGERRLAGAGEPSVKLVRNPALVVGVR